MPSVALRLLDFNLHFFAMPMFKTVVFYNEHYTQLTLTEVPFIVTSESQVRSRDAEECRIVQ